MTDLDQEGISRRLRARFVTYQEAPPRHRLAVLAIAAAVALSLAYGVYVWYYWRHHISTDDAFISAHIAPMSARVPGTVSEVLVNDNQDVKADQVLLRLDPRDYEVAVAQARAVVASAKGDLESAVANVPLTGIRPAAWCSRPTPRSGPPSTVARWPRTISTSAAVRSRPSRPRWRRPTRRCARRRPTTIAARRTATASPSW
jgi:multidrug efflux pump subunit AcrA (membrane-fusion protein)